MPSRLRGKAEIRFHGAEAFWETRLSLIIGHRCDDDHVLALLPVHWRCDRMLRRKLAGVEEPQHLVEIAPAAHRVGQHRLDLLVRSDDEDGAHRGVVGRRPALGRVPGFRRQHVVKLCHLQLGIADHRVVHRVTLGLLDVLRPPAVLRYRVDAQPDDLAAAFVEFRLQPGHVAELRGADRRKILWMRKEDGPAVADPLMEVYRALRGFRGEVGCFGIDSQRHIVFPPSAGSVRDSQLLRINDGE
jgi:hypothetical protein